MKIINSQVYGLFESIKRSGYPMRNGEPDSFFNLRLREKERKRAKKLSVVPSGSGHDNFLKGIIVQFDLRYPEYFSPQLQRYHWVDIISSQSKMHKIMSNPLTQEDFAKPIPQSYLTYLNNLIKEKWFEQLINDLPLSYMKWMGISTNYLQLKTIYNQRRNHKLKEWQYFCDWIESLSMSFLITGKNEN